VGRRRVFSLVINAILSYVVYVKLVANSNNRPAIGQPDGRLVPDMDMGAMFAAGEGTVILYVE